MSKKQKDNKNIIRTRHVHVKHSDTPATWFDWWTRNAHALYNSATFLNRNTLTALAKPENEWHDNQRHAIQELENVFPKHKKTRWKNATKKRNKAAELTRELITQAADKDKIDGSILDAMIEKESRIRILEQQSMLNEHHRRANYNELDAYYKITNNAHYRALPVHAAQNILREVNTAWDEWGQALHDWRHGNPSGRNGKPGIPQYSRAKAKTITIPAVDITLQKTSDGRVLAVFPCSKQQCIVEATNCIPPDYKLVTVQVTPATGGYDVDFCCKKKKPKQSSAPNLAGGDVGLENVLTIVVNSEDIRPLIIDGKTLKSCNRYWNKKIAAKKSELPNGTYSSTAIRRLYRKRSIQLHQEMDMIAARAVSFLVDSQVREFVVGHGKGWKEDFAAKTSKKQDALRQSFIQVPFNYLLDRLSDKCAEVGIKCVIREESYTSKASLIDLDEIPTYGEENGDKYEFSGYRVSRGLYCSSRTFLPGSDKGVVLNADVNGAGNILRKEHADAFSHVVDWRFLMNPVRVRVSGVMRQ